MESMKEYLLKERYKQLDYNMPFVKLFGVRLFRFFPHVMFGFDVIAFDKWIEPHKNESTIQAVKRKFGQNGVNLIDKLLA